MNQKRLSRCCRQKGLIPRNVKVLLYNCINIRFSPVANPQSSSNVVREIYSCLAISQAKAWQRQAPLPD
jgi:hypothetical protein